MERHDGRGWVPAFIDGLLHEMTKGIPPRQGELLGTPERRRGNVTKKEIVKVISDEVDLTQLKTKEVVQKTFDAIIDTLVKYSRIELRNFGVFEVKKREPRKARNPRTGAEVFVPAKDVVTFKPGKEMADKIRWAQAAQSEPAAESSE